jgi:hypothetical protein
MATGRDDIDLQCNAGYARMEIINVDNTPFDIDVTDALVLELKNSAGTYVPVFGGAVSDFGISVRSPEEIGFITIGNILAVGSLSKLTTALFPDALAKDYDGTQIYDVLNELLINSWYEVAPALQWFNYDPATTWADAENVGLGEIDQPGFFLSRYYTNIKLGFLSQPVNYLLLVSRFTHGRCCHSNKLFGIERAGKIGKCFTDNNSALDCFWENHFIFKFSFT